MNPVSKEGSGRNFRVMFRRALWSHKGFGFFVMFCVYFTVASILCEVLPLIGMQTDFFGTKRGGLMFSIFIAVSLSAFLFVLGNPPEDKTDA